ncbi:hypothetical protein [Plesiocystis pacifica]|nr:hypothetical protein [Plesiocystis pacifica]
MPGSEGRLCGGGRRRGGAYDVTVDEQSAATVVSHDRLSKFAP